MLRSAALLVLATIAGAAFAHHSQVGLFDSKSTVEVNGVVTKVDWRNPHGQILLDVTDESGGVTEWDAETASVSVLRIRGIDPGQAVKVGDRVTIAGSPSTRNRPQVLATSMLLASGEEFTFGGREAHFPAGKSGRLYGAPVIEADVARARAEADGIFRVWSTIMSDPEQFPMFKGGYPLTDAGRTGAAAFNPSDNVLLKCGTKGQPLIMITPLPIEFVRVGDTIEMRIEEYDSLRVIHMNLDAPAPAEHTLMGFSRGWFEGETLVVETDHVAAGYFDHEGVPMSEQVSTVERFIPSEDYSRLDYELTTTDPVNFTEPFTLRRHFVWQPGDYVHPYECLDRFGAED
jgi:hypothetical protein